MAKTLLYELIQNYIEKHEHGIFLLPVPTGYGKTYSSIDYITDQVIVSHERTDKPKFIFVTNLKKNLKEEDFREMFEKKGHPELFEKEFFFLKNNVDNILQQYGKTAVPKDIRSMESYQLLGKKINFYCKKEDAHTVDSEIPLQHITVETVRNCSNAQLLLPAAAKCIYDLIIKDDIQKKHISLFDWKKLGFIVPVEFWMKVFEDKEKKIRKYGSVIIDSKGSIQFSLTGNEAEPAVQILQMDKSYKTVIKKGKDYNVIQDTTLFTIPNLEEIYHQMETVPPKKSISRSRENIENVLPDIVDIRTWMEKGCLYYIVGNNSYGMDGKFLRATPVRKVIAKPGSELFFQELLPTLAMPFVRNKRYTVYPFPLKYIREYVVYCRVRGELTHRLS